MKLSEDLTVSRAGWLTRDEVAKFVPGQSPSTATEAERSIFDMLMKVHELADRLDDRSRGPERRIAMLERALQFYANRGRYGRWGGDRDHWVFHPEAWGESKYHDQPPPYAPAQPWMVAEAALNGTL